MLCDGSEGRKEGGQHRGGDGKGNQWAASSQRLFLAFPSVTAMSRAPPFPTRRRAPSNASNDPYSSQPTSAPGGAQVRPLQISRPTTPSNSSYISSSPQYSQYGVPNTAPIGPLRPQRSEMRARASDYSTSERGSVASGDPYYRDSLEGSRGDPRAYAASNPNTPQSRSRTPRATNGGYTPAANDNIETPTSLGSVLSAFKSAGSRKKTLDSEDAEYWRDQREQEIEAEKARQQRIREKVPGLRVRSNTKGGEIDGRFHLTPAILIFTPPCSRPRPGQRWLGVCDRF